MEERRPWASLLAVLRVLRPWRGGPAPVWTDLAPAGDAPSAGTLAAEREALERMLLDDHLPFWYPGTLDREAGGFRLDHDASGAWLARTDKGIVSQARNTWFFARLAGSRHGRPEHLEAARHGVEFLRERLWDPEHGGFFWAVDARGERATRPEKQLYGQAFGLFALSRYAAVAGDAGAASLAGTLFGLLEARAHDAASGGYRESFHRDWTPMSPRSLSPLGFRAGLKLTNTHLHLLEALTEHARLSPGPVVRERLRELIAILGSTVVRAEAGACRDFHHPDWRPFRGRGSGRVSYGHDLENAWLLLEACEVAGLPLDRVTGVCRTLVATAVRHGLDTARGGFFESGRPGAPADRRAKTWWVQAEALVATLRLHRHTGNPAYHDVFARTLDWVARHQVDPRGGWHHTVSPDGAASGPKAGPWKAAYHDGRAMLECLDMLDALLAAS